MLPEPIRKPLLQFCNAELTPKEFEAWVCTVDVEEHFGRTSYFDLISADYAGRDALAMQNLCRRILDEHHPGAFNRYRVVRILEFMLKDDESLLEGLRRLVQLRHDGCDFIPIEFVGFDSETDSIPSPKAYHLWEPAALANLLARVAPYRRQISDATRELLDDLRQRFPDDV
jgi:hypothetical protein